MSQEDERNPSDDALEGGPDTTDRALDDAPGTAVLDDDEQPAEPNEPA